MKKTEVEVGKSNLVSVEKTEVNEDILHEDRYQALTLTLTYSLTLTLTLFLCSSSFFSDDSSSKENRSKGREITFGFFGGENRS